MAAFITKEVISTVCCPIYLLSHLPSPQTFFYQSQSEHLNNNWKELVFRAFFCFGVFCGFFAYLLCSFFSPDDFRLLWSHFTPIVGVSLADGKVRRSPWREGWQCTESGLCGANGAVYSPKLGIALEAAEAVSSEISADFGDVGKALSYVVRKGICSIKTPSASRLML